MPDLTAYQDYYPDYWQPVLLHQYLLQHARHNPQAIAIIAAKVQWSYQDLADHAHNYARTLHNSGLRAGDRIILKLEPSPQAIALIIACSCLGLVFIPLDPATPANRVQLIIELTEAKLHLQAANKQTKSSESSSTAVILVGTISDCALEISGKLSDRLDSYQPQVLESDLAYIIFTSGTTGTPKGIIMTHRAVLVFFRALVDYCQLTSAARVGTLAPLQFDFSLLDLGLALGSGATLVQIPRKLTLIPAKLLRYLEQQQVTQLNCVPSIWKLLLRHSAADISQLKHLNTTLFAGEAFAIADIIKLQYFLPFFRIINCFGQSESIACSFTEVPNPLPPDTTHLAIGFAHPGAEMLLLDDKQQIINQPNQIGEIYLRGANLFSGYWRDQSTTDAALIPNPFQPFSREKIFRTGDLAYKASTGELYLVERRDLQVKIRGNWVELGEIEHRLRSHDSIAQVSVIAIPRQDNLTLAAFLVSQSNQAILSTTEIQHFCAETMPSYMIPTEVYFLDALPVTINGKVDLSKLKAMGHSNN